MASSGFSENKGLGGVLSLAGSQNLVLVLDFRIRAPHVESKTDSGFHIPDIQVLNFSPCQWDLDSEFQWLVGFWIP